MRFWQSDTTFNFIHLNLLEDPQLTNMSVGFIAQPSQKTRLQAFIISYSDKIKNPGNLPNLNRIPYRPDYQIPVRLDIKLMKDLEFAVEGIFSGERVKRLDSDEKLPTYGLLHAQLTKSFGKKISVTAAVNNILDSEYEVWEGYKELGVQFLLGARAQF